MRTVSTKIDGVSVQVTGDYLVLLVGGRGVILRALAHDLY